MTALLWLFAHLETLLMLVGVAAIVIPLLDQGVRRLEARWPNSRFLKILDKTLFGCGNALVNIGSALDKVLALRRTYRP